MLAISRRAAGELRRDIDSQHNGKPHHLSPPVHALATMPFWMKERWVLFPQALLRLPSLVYSTAYEYQMASQCHHGL